MATVVMVYPRDGGTYGTNEDGSLVPFVAYGYVDAPGQVVSLYEDATAALLGSVAASATPEPSGTWVGWYRWDIPVANWTTAAGALVPVMAGRGAMAIPSLAGTHPILTMAGSGAMADTSYTSATVFAVPVMGGKGAVLSVGITAAVGLPAMAGVGACDAPSIASDSTAPTVTAFTVGTPTGLVVPISSFTASDAVGVTGYIVTESSTAPAVGAAGWTGSAPSSYTCSGAGTFDLYPWAKDAAGNVSSVFATPRSVTVSAGEPGIVKLYLHSAATAVSPLPAAPTATPDGNNFNVTWSALSTMRHMDEVVDTDSLSETTLSATTLAQTAAQFHGIARFCTAPLTAGSVVNVTQGLGVRLYLSESNGNANYAVSRLKLYVWRPSTQQVIATMWSGRMSVWKGNPGTVVTLTSETLPAGGNVAGISAAITSTSMRGGWEVFEAIYQGSTSQYWTATSNTNGALRGSDVTIAQDGDVIVAEFSTGIAQSSASAYTVSLKAGGKESDGVAGSIQFYSALLGYV